MKTQDFTVIEFIGHWRVRCNVFCFDWIFRNDCSFVGKFSVLGIPLLRLTGAWSIDGNRLHSIYAIGLKDTDTLLEVAQDYFILVTRGGTRRRWERVYEGPMA